jgi:glutathione S-transferase
MKLYGMLVSPYVARVVLAARAKGLELAAEAPPGGGIKSPEYLALNPMGKMPTFEDHGRCIAESMVILDYLDEAYPQQPLLPAAPMDRAQSRLLGRIVDLYVMAQSGPFFRNMNPAQRNDAEVEAARKTFAKALADLEHFMGPGPYAVGDRLGYADCALLPCLLMTGGVVMAFGISNQFEGLPKLNRWWQQMQADPVTAPFCKEYTAAMQAFLASRRG